MPYFHPNLLTYLSQCQEKTEAVLFSVMIFVMKMKHQDVHFHQKRARKEEAGTEHCRSFSEL